VFHCPTTNSKLFLILFPEQQKESFKIWPNRTRIGKVGWFFGGRAAGLAGWPEG